MKINVNKKSVSLEIKDRTLENKRLERKFKGVNIHSVLRHIEKLEKRIEELELKLK